MMTHQQVETARLPDLSGTDAALACLRAGAPVRTDLGERL
jgi:hypothetical protein